MEGIPPGDINAKYQKLAAEYSKLRIHVKVLKKGVLDEQAKSSELKELLKEREKASRKAELEIDSLNFRNQQLTKRITVLQDEIESLQLKNTKKIKSKNAKEDKQASTSGVFDNGLLQEEFQKKIFENAQLASQLSDSHFEVMQIRTRLEDMEKFLNESECKYKCEIAKLKNINQELLYSLENTCLKDKHNFSNRHMLASTSNHQIPSVNGDLFSEVGSLIGSEDALSSVDVNEQLCLKNDALEKENHRMKMECELLKMENEQFRLASMKISTSNRRSRSDCQDFGDFSSVSYGNVHPDGILTSLLGTVSIPFILSNEILQREENMKNYYRDKMTALAMEKQKLGSMAQHHEGECEALRQRLQDAEKERESNTRMFQVTQDTISRLEDELHSTSTNYEQQLTLLTEHTGNLNDKLALQFEEILSLKSVLSRKK